MLAKSLPNLIMLAQSLPNLILLDQCLPNLILLAQSLPHLIILAQSPPDGAARWRPVLSCMSHGEELTSSVWAEPPHS